MPNSKTRAEREHELRALLYQCGAGSLLAEYVRVVGEQSPPIEPEPAILIGAILDKEFPPET